MINKLDVIRKMRNKLLIASDWTQLPDAPLTNDQKIAWQQYRQQLRDLPATFDENSSLIWPTKPTGVL